MRARVGAEPVPPPPPAWGPSTGVLLVAAGLAAGALAWWWTSAPPAAAPPAVAATSLPAAAPPAAAAAPALPPSVGARLVAGPAPRASASPAPPATREADGDPTPDLSAYVNPGEKPSMEEVIRRLREAGVQGGLAAFSPPGTRPPLIGLAVPEDFVLPPGFVRHHQATDDGQRIEAVLMFAPDHRPVDAAGRPVPLPADRLVPPELAPPGLPLRRIVVPAPLEATRPGR